MRFHELIESYVIDGQEREVPSGQYPLPDGFGENFINYVSQYHVGSDETAYFDYRDWLSLLDNLHTNGGDIYRAVFLPKGTEPQKPFGQHWSMKPLSDHALWRLWSDVCYEKMDRYSDNGYEMVLLRARTGPHNVTIDGVNLPEEWAEFEVNLIDPAAIDVVDMKRLPVPTES
jgi:hypothetical protein